MLLHDLSNKDLVFENFGQGQKAYFETKSKPKGMTVVTLSLTFAFSAPSFDNVYSRVKIYEKI